MYKQIILFVCILSLISSLSAYAQNSCITQGLNYPNTAQNPDGSLDNITSTTEITRTTVAVINTLQGLALPLQEAINYITATQSADGSWNEDAYSMIML